MEQTTILIGMGALAAALSLKALITRLELSRAKQMAFAALGRQPTAIEISALAEFLSGQGATGAPEVERLAALAHALVNTREFIYLR